MSYLILTKDTTTYVYPETNFSILFNNRILSSILKGFTPESVPEFELIGYGKFKNKQHGEILASLEANYTVKILL